VTCRSRINAGRYLLDPQRSPKHAAQDLQFNGQTPVTVGLLGTQELTAIADRGYFKSKQILACHEAGVTAIVPKSMTSNATADGRFGREDFIYGCH